MLRFGKTMINTVRRHINVSRLNAASASSSVAEGDLYQNEINAEEGEGKKTPARCMAHARKHIGTELIWMT